MSELARAKEFGGKDRTSDLLQQWRPMKMNSEGHRQQLKRQWWLATGNNDCRRSFELEQRSTAR